MKNFLWLMFAFLMTLTLAPFERGDAGGNGNEKPGPSGGPKP